MRAISIEGIGFSYEAAKNIKNSDVQALLAACYKQSTIRPQCRCTGLYIPLQIKRRSGIYHLARMPGKGLEHTQDCGFYGETEHSESHSSSINIELSQSLLLNDKEAPAGLVTLSGLLNNIWTLAGLNRWSVNDVPFGWSVVSKKIYNSVKGYTINGIPITQLLWVLPHMNDEKLPQVRDECLNFVKSCNIHGRYALIVAPIGTSEYQNHSMCLRFRSMAKPPIFIDYKRFPIKTLSLKETGKHPYPVAIMLVKAPNDKPYLLATDISMLWMTTNYLPCVTKDRVSTLAKALVTAHELTVPLDVESGKLLPEIATITNTKWTIKALLTDSHGGLPPWLV